MLKVCLISSGVFPAQQVLRRCLDFHYSQQQQTYLWSCLLPSNMSDPRVTWCWDSWRPAQTYAEVRLTNWCFLKVWNWFIFLFYQNEFKEGALVKCHKICIPQLDFFFSLDWLVINFLFSFNMKCAILDDLSEDLCRCVGQGNWCIHAHICLSSQNQQILSNYRCRN